ncbi:glutamate 5-kinase [Hirschia baltica]|uniref:Glutamate 5-kinase n=1 Tax=Hirschia baltica (strain ATCC 49814 / DSM 5838 / IFAM 1418) TaxID=582402 RepID=C6XL38_HIRBI|nr:glutamate 5-kinase [Hirschia baltica]ACT57867.1 glutamate 5-kinase [Hirschia baltica ATCC 49814]
MDTITSTEGVDLLAKAERVVIKLGSALIVDEDGLADAARIQAISRDVIFLLGEGKQVVIVSSGAVALGREALNLGSKKLKLEEKQAAAAAGQLRLMRTWEDAFLVHNIPVAQALLTIDDTEIRRRWLNARATLDTLLEAGAVPIVNENDTIATDGIRFGDNDRLAARVAQMISADVLILLSDIDGLYTADPRKDPKAKHIPFVRELTPDIMAMGGEPNAETGMGSGGMATKLEAARIAMTAGCATVIALGRPESDEFDLPLSAINNGALATWFIPSFTRETARIQWLMGALQTSGTVYVDEGAARAVKNGKSLLPAGILSVEGHFDRGDGIDVVGPGNVLISRGFSAYSSSDSMKLIGCNSSQIESIVGYKGRPALIHTDDMLVLES